MRWLLGIGFSVMLIVPVSAQQPFPLRPNPPLGGTQAPQPPPPPAQPDSRHQSRIDQLFERLAAARDEAEAAAIADQITRIWTRSGSDTLDLLLDRVGKAMQAKEAITALDLIDSILALKPDWAEAYSRRAAVLFQQDDLDGAMRDLRKALSLEPRHFQALAGVGMVLNQNGQKKAALAAFRAALALNPQFKGIRDMAERLQQEFGDQSI